MNIKLMTGQAVAKIFKQCALKHINQDRYRFEKKFIATDYQKFALKPTFGYKNQTIFQNILLFFVHVELIMQI